MTAWTDDQVAHLTKLWAEGLPASEIAQLLGMTKNTVIGKAHRLGLPARASPIAGGARPGQPRRKPVPPAVRTPAACQWPHGDPGTKVFRFCGAAAVEGRPYCAEHCAKAYVVRPAKPAFGYAR